MGIAHPRAIPNIGRKPSYLSPFILHLYKHYDCITPEEEDRLTIAMEEVAYKIRIPARLATRSSRMCLPHHPGVRHFRGPHPLFRGPGGLSLLPPSPHEQPQQPPQTEARTRWDSIWRNVDPSGWEIPDVPFKRVHDKWMELQAQFHCLEHITRGASQAMRARKYYPGDPKISRGAIRDIWSDPGTHGASR